MTTSRTILFTMFVAVIALVSMGMLTMRSLRSTALEPSFDNSEAQSIRQMESSLFGTRATHS